MTNSDEHKEASTAESESYPSVCVITHPLGPAGENATRTLLRILAAITSVRLVTADLPADSAIRDHHTFVEFTDRDAGQSNVFVAAARFILNQMRMCRAIAGSDEEMVLFFGATAYVLPMLWARLLGRTVIVEPRGDVPRTLRLDWERRMPGVLARTLATLVWLLERTGYRIADAIVTYTPAMAEELGLDCYEEKLYPEGARYVDVEQFSVTTDFEERPIAVGYFGRLEVEKKIPTLVEVAKRLPEHIQFRFVGDGDYRSIIKKELASEIGQEQVTLTGWIDHEEVPTQLNQIRLLVLTSEPTEGLPTVVLESFACGTPVYAAPVSGIPDVVRDGETGFLMTDCDPDAVVERITDAVMSGTLAGMSSTCRATAEEEFSFDAAVKRYRTILQSVGNAARS